MRPKVFTVPQMIDLVIRLLTEKAVGEEDYWINEAKRRRVNDAIIVLKELKDGLGSEYKDHKQFGKPSVE